MVQQVGSRRVRLHIASGHVFDAAAAEQGVDLQGRSFSVCQSFVACYLADPPAIFFVLGP